MVLQVTMATAVQSVPHAGKGTFMVKNFVIWSFFFPFPILEYYV